MGLMAGKRVGRGEEEEEEEEEEGGTSEGCYFDAQKIHFNP